MRMKWDFFYRQLCAGKWIDETCFYFRDDKEETERYLGYLPQYEKPYWIGCCDIDGGCEFKTAEELVNAPVFDGRSLKERWDSVVICHIEGLGLDDWMGSFEHC